MIRRLLILTLLLQVSATLPTDSVSVVVATRDYAVGEIVDFDGVTQKAVPRGWGSKSVVMPNAVSYVVKQPTHVPILAGDLLRWSFFETQRGTAAPAACGQPDDSALVAVSKAREVQLERR